MITNFDFKKYILNLDTPKNQSVCAINFNFLYEKYSVDEWINTDLSFEIANFILQNRPDLLSLAIRINVQVNLFLRTISKFSNNKEKIFNNVKYSLGCFCLTENKTGVLSGLNLDTTFEEHKEHYILDTNNGYKNWISQGIHANYAIVFAKNKINDKDMRIFLINLYNENISREKILDLDVTSSLDLAKIKFNKVKIPKNSLLEKSKGEKKINLLNGIFYGRYMIAEATISVHKFPSP